MLKRILPVLAGACLGLVLAVVLLRQAAGWGWLPNRELNRASDYVREVMSLVNEHYVEPEPARYDRLAREAIHGVVGTLDPHSEFLEAGDFANFEDDLDGEFGGIGVQVEQRDGKIVIIAPIAGTPGDRAGLLRGDEIISVDGRGVGDKAPMTDAIDRLRGKPGTRVRVGLRRPGTGRDFEVSLVREKIAMESVRESRLLGDGIGYIQLVDFSARTGEQFLTAVDALIEQGAHSLILDLRNNPGGLLEAAVAVAEPFFQTGELVVYTEGRDPADREELRAGMTGEPWALPLAVLINSGTASAAEIVTGALKDTRRAVIVGERSFGKGSVQTLFKLRNGEGMRITTARYYTPKGVSIHRHGIEPDVELVVSPEDDGKLRLQRLRGDVTDPAEFKARFGFTPIADAQLEAAKVALRGLELLRQRGAR
ncbi:MAG: S41 family peptidase [Opitutaceae bacterium]|nr:S41 family peptidase [Opitutaceae bacterium]